MGDGEVRQTPSNPIFVSPLRLKHALLPLCTALCPPLQVVRTNMFSNCLFVCFECCLWYLERGALGTPASTSIGALWPMASVASVNWPQKTKHSKRWSRGSQYGFECIISNDVTAHCCPWQRNTAEPGLTPRIERVLQSSLERVSLCNNASSRTRHLLSLQLDRV